MEREKLSEDRAHISVRISGATARRFNQLLRDAQMRGYPRKSDIVKELLGIAPLKALTPEDVIYFQTGKRPKK